MEFGSRASFQRPSGAGLSYVKSPVVPLADSLHHRLISVVPPAPCPPGL